MNIHNSTAKRIKQLLKTRKGSMLAALVAGLIVIGVGYAVLRTSAVSYYAGVNANDGTLSGNAALVNDGGGNGGVTVEFGTNSGNGRSEPEPKPEPDPDPEPTPPPPGAKPGSHNTGPSNPGNLTARGSITITQDGYVLENVNITGIVRVQANNVVIRNFKINAGGGHYGIQATYGKTGLVIEDGEIYNMASAGVYGGNFTARRLNVHNSGNDAFKPTSNAVIENSWIHHLGSIPTSHADGLQMVAGGNVTIRGNNFDMPNDEPGFNNSICIIIQTNNGPIDNILIENNWINGGGWSIQINDKDTGHGAPTNVRILDNRFGRDYQFGIWTFDGNVQRSGNVWEDTGEPV